MKKYIVFLKNGSDDEKWALKVEVSDHGSLVGVIQCGEVAWCYNATEWCKCFLANHASMESEQRLKKWQAWESNLEEMEKPGFLRAGDIE